MFDRLPLYQRNPADALIATSTTFESRVVYTLRGPLTSTYTVGATVYPLTIGAAVARLEMLAGEHIARRDYTDSPEEQMLRDLYPDLKPFGANPLWEACATTADYTATLQSYIETFSA